MSFFTGDSYHTKPDQPRLLLDKLALNTRIYFFAGYFGIVLDCRRQALKGVFDTKAWASASFDIFKL
ncbi:MAG TPA: 1-acyl-sn-glycerol-3-phosphate acyltransferase, partial [Verrucomicrobiae bacterium]|nr:1-acyl-sn-glycerol-3-phosphate acyltransferase [Verrucomicrobiae bacterium]